MHIRDFNFDDKIVKCLGGGWKKASQSSHCIGRANWYRMDRKEEEEVADDEKKPKQKKKEEKTKQEEHPIVSVLFLPKSVRSGLKQKMQDKERTLANVTKSTVRYCEVAGKSVLSLLHKSDKWSGIPCHRGDKCKPCSTPGDVKQNCTASGVYITWCLDCERNQEQELQRRKEEHQGDKKTVAKGEMIKYMYCGQTAGGIWRRGILHDQDLKRCVPDTHQFEHGQAHHQGQEQPPQFGMKLIKRCSTVLQRLLYEAVKIRQFSSKKNIVLLNSRFEMSSVLPVLSVLKEERLFPASNQDERKPEQKDSDPEVVPSNNSSLKSKPNVKFKEKDDGLHKKAAASAHSKTKQTRLSFYFPTS